jgi:Xaa-Pro aminopeptidase
MKLENPFNTPNIRAHIKRRVQLAKTLKQGIVIIPTAPEVTRNADAHYEFRWDSFFYYLTGFREPEAVLVITLGSKPKSILFCRDKNIEREIWDGFRYGPAVAQQAFGVDAAYSISALDDMLPNLIANQPCIHTPLGVEGNWDSRVAGWLNAVRGKSRAGVTAPKEIHDLHAVVAEQRLIKDDHEIALMRRAAVISSEAHRRAMRVARPGLYEFAVEAELMHEFIKSGARQAAYGSIVATGANACVLHYSQNNAVIKAGDLMLIDAGCEFESYAADITRTFPVSGKFSGPQKAIYELVLASQLASIKAVKPGAEFNKYHDVATKVLAQGLIDLKLCKGSLDSVLERETYKQFYMHRTGHWLGLDVHDAGAYKHNGKSVKLQAGMVLTVEPGLYFRPAANVPKQFWDIGVRIEDDVLVTKTSNDVLTKSCPKTVADVEATIAEGN